VVAFLAEFGVPDAAPPAPGLRAWSVALRVPNTQARLPLACWSLPRIALPRSLRRCMQRAASHPPPHGARA
jgi:hypothetical protein